MTKQELPKAYDYKSTEPRIYAMWEAGGYFKPHNDPNKPDFDPTVEPFVIASFLRPSLILSNGLFNRPSKTDR